MKQFNIKIILLSCILTAVVLFGSWFAIQFFNTEKPIQDWARTREGMEIVDLDRQKGKWQVEVSFENRKNFGLDVLQLEDFLSKTLPGKQINVLISPEQGEYHPFWLEHSAPFLEWKEQGKYTQLSAEIDRLAKKGEIEGGHVTMNNERIFLYLDLPDDQEVYVTWLVDEREGGERR